MRKSASSASRRSGALFEQTQPKLLGFNGEIPFRRERRMNPRSGRSLAARSAECQSESNSVSAEDWRACFEA